MFAVKRDGTKVPLDIEKIHEACQWACEGIDDVSVSQLQLNAGLKLYNNIKTSDIQETLIRSAADLISEETPNYQYVAAKLISWTLRKEVYGGLIPSSLLDVMRDNVKKGFYTSELLDWYSKEEWEELNSYIDHSRDDLLTYAGMELFRTKYLIRNRHTGSILETPQVAFMLIAATFFHRYPKETRLKWVKEFYDAQSRDQTIVLPTPIMAGLRSPDKQFSSCVLIESDDNLNSIFSTATAIGLYVAKRAGIGIGGGGLRSLGDPIRGGKSTHTGVYSFWNLWNSAVNSCNQGGVRKGSGNLCWPGWHAEFRTNIVLKNNKGTPDNRITQLDYTVQLSRLFYQRLIEGGNVTFFSPGTAPGLYDAFFRSNEEFEELYMKYENDKKIPKTHMSALEFFTTIMTERKETGRIYIQNVDHCNSHGAFRPELAPVRMTNLCVEVQLPTQPFENPFDGSGEIALCTLSAINWGRIKSPKDFERPARLLVRALDELLDYQDYPVAAGANGALNRRSLGIGIAGFSHWKAKVGINYATISKDDLDDIDTWAQAWSYYLLRASIDLAAEKGPCKFYDQTKYSLGLFPIDTYKKDVDELVDHQPEKNDWEELRKRMATFGIRNSTLMALMPGETSTMIPNATNGIEDPRSAVSVKINKDQVTKQVVPEIKKLGKKYDYLWEQTSPMPYLKTMAIIQKYVDQSISVNTSYNPQFYPEEKISMQQMLEHLIWFYKWGGKALYYYNTYDGAGEVKTTSDEEDCEGCKL